MTTHEEAPKVAFRTIDGQPSIIGQPYLPTAVLRGADSEGRALREGSMSQLAGVDSGSPLDGVSVVVVDDHPAVRDVITQLLEHYGAMVTAVPGVPEALEALERERPDVLISDIEMPGEDGYMLIRKVRAWRPERGGDIPAVALTGLSSAEDRALLLRAGFQYHVPKPVDARRLTAVVAILASRNDSREPAPVAAAGRAEGPARRSGVGAYPRGRTAERALT